MARCLSKLGVVSRAEAERLVLAGRVTVAGRVVRDPERRTDPRREALAIDGQPVTAAAPVHIMLHKPSGVITTRSDERGRSTIYDLLPNLPSWVAPVGRLDADTTGLLLLTNDTQLANWLTGGSPGVEKRYEALVDGELTGDALAALTRGIEIALPGRGLYRTQPARCEVLARTAAPCRTLVAVSVAEGKNRQVRRMFEAVGHPVLALHRTHVGSLELGALPVGASRVLTAAEVRALRPTGARGRRS